MKKDLIFSSALLIVSILLFLLKTVGMAAHIFIAIIGVFVLFIYTVLTKNQWKIVPLEIVMRAFYGIALITGPVVLKLNDIVLINIIHKLSALLFVVLLVVLFVYKLITYKKAK